MPQSDIAGKEHWDGLYKAKDSTPPDWRPRSYDEMVIGHALLGEIERLKPRTLLEVGCGDSVWLPYLARETGASVAGVDYSEAGCELTRRRMKAHGVEGQVWCADLFGTTPDEIGQHDFVFSLGLVEHFSDLEGVLSALLKFVRPGGTLFTEVPNLRSAHGMMMWVWQPALLAKHELIGKGQLKRAYERLGLKGVRGGYLGAFSLSVVGWDIYARWPKLAERAAPWVFRFNGSLDPYLQRRRWYGGTAPLAPYLYAVGQKPGAER
jgi:SAM-dependent methyltransferase